MSTTVDLHGRHLLTLNDLSRAEIVSLLDLAAELKRARIDGRQEQRLKGKEIVLISETDPTRARCALEVAARDQGAQVAFIGPTGTHTRDKHTVRDTARALGRMYDAIGYRGFAYAVARELAQWAGVPVYHGLSHERHPTDILADFLTFEAHVAKPLDEVAFCYLGDARFKMADAYLLSGVKLGMDVRLAGPRSLWPDQEITAVARRIARRSGARITITDDLHEAVEGADALLTDAWVLLGEGEETTQERIELLLPYQVNAGTVELTGNPDVKFMHCLPAFHNTGTSVGRGLAEKYGLSALEVTEDVFESSACVVFDEAENRVHAITAVLVATLER